MLHVSGQSLDSQETVDLIDQTEHLKEEIDLKSGIHARWLRDASGQVVILIQGQGEHSMLLKGTPV